MLSHKKIRKHNKNFGFLRISLQQKKIKNYFINNLYKWKIKFRQY